MTGLPAEARSGAYRPSAFPPVGATRRVGIMYAALVGWMAIATNAPPSVLVALCLLGLVIMGMVREMRRLNLKPVSFGASLLAFSAVGVIGRALFPNAELSRLPSYLFVSRADLDRSVALLAYGLALAGAVYMVLRKLLPQGARHIQYGTNREPEWTAVLVVGWSIAALRVVLQLGFDVGVVGAHSSAPLPGLLYYLVHTGFLACIATVAVMAASRKHQRSWLHLGLLAGVFIVMGVGGGRRGAGAVAVAVVLASVASVGLPRSRVRLPVVVIFIAFLVLISFGVAATRRSGLGVRGPIATEAYERLGGANFLAPVVASRADPSLEQLWSGYVEVVNVQVYRLPVGVQTAFGVTAWGFGHLVGGTTGVLVVGALVGIVAAMLDYRLGKAASTLARAAGAVALVIWYSMLQDGNVPARINEFLALGAVMIGLRLITLDATRSLRWGRT